MSVFILQIIGMITMFCDHLGACFLYTSVTLRCIGRIAFPVYGFLFAEGFRHYKDDPQRISKHLSMLVILTLISEPFYDLEEAVMPSWEKMVSSQSSMITLLIAFLGLLAIEKWKDKPLTVFAAIVLSAFCTSFIKSNFKFAGVLLIYGFYFYLNWAMEQNKPYFVRFGVLLAMFVLFLPIYHWARYEFCDFATYVEKLKGDNVFWYLTYLPTAALLASYTGKLGYRSKKFKTVYQWFYPAHLAIFGIINQFVW